MNGRWYHTPNWWAEVLRTPVHAPKANCYVERLIGTIRRECLDWLIPLSENHLCTVLARFIRHYNRSRPHASLGPGIPDPADGLPEYLLGKDLVNRGVEVICRDV